MILNPVIYYDPALFAARVLAVSTQPKEPKQRELRPRTRTERAEQLAARLGITWKEYVSQYVRQEVDMNFLSKYSDKYICIVNNEQPLAKVLQFPRGLIRRANLRKRAILRFEKRRGQPKSILQFGKKESLAEQLGIAVGSKNYESRRQLVNSFIQKRIKFVETPKLIKDRI